MKQVHTIAMVGGAAGVWVGRVPLVRVSTMAEREPPMRPDQLRSLSGRPRPPPDTVPAPVILVSASSITCTSVYQSNIH